jgi:hypothetical protein
VGLLLPLFAIGTPLDHAHVVGVHLGTLLVADQAAAGWERPENQAPLFSGLEKRTRKTNRREERVSGEKMQERKKGGRI